MILKPRLFRKPNPGHPLADFVGLWLMNEGSGNKVFDLSGNGNTGTLNGNPQWTAGKFGPAIDFDGDDEITLDGISANLINSLFTASTSWSACFWFNPDNYGNQDSGAQSIITLTDGGPNKAEIRYHDSWGSEDIRIYLLDDWGANNIIVIDDIQVTFPTWIHIGLSWENGVVKSYVNGVYNASTNVAQAIFPDNTPTSGTIGNAFDGRLSDLIIYNRALSASEIAQLYLKPFCMFEREPIELWAAAMGGVPPGLSIPVAMANYRRRRIA